MGKRSWVSEMGWHYDKDYSSFTPRSYMTYKEEDIFKGRGGSIGMPKFDDKGNLLIYGRAKRNLPIPSNQSSNQISGITSSGLPAGLTEAGWDKTKVVYADTGLNVFERTHNLFGQGSKWKRNEPLGGYIKGVIHGPSEDYDYMEQHGHQGNKTPYYRQFAVGTNRRYPHHKSTNYRQNRYDEEKKAKMVEEVAPKHDPYAIVSSDEEDEDGDLRRLGDVPMPEEQYPHMW